VAPSVQCRKVWLTPTTRVPCSNAAKMRNPLKLVGVPQTTGPISAAGGPKFTILWGHLEEILLVNNVFFPTVDTCLSYEKLARQSCAMAPRLRIFGDFLRPVFSASRVQHVVDLHPKFARRPHYVCKCGRHRFESATAEIRRGKRKQKEPQGKSIMSASAKQGGHKYAGFIVMGGYSHLSPSGHFPRSILVSFVCTCIMLCLCRAPLASPALYLSCTRCWRPRNVT